MISFGLTSVTFRKLEYKNIIDLAVGYGLDGIEWGGDIHVPPGDIHRARKVYNATVESGLKVLSYGSYYKFGMPGETSGAFKPILETALCLNTKTIRVWAGTKASALHTCGEIKSIIEDIRDIADTAGEHGIDIAFEYHRGTLTDTSESTLSLLDGVNRENVKTYWQPNPDISHESNLCQLKAALPFLKNVHVFNWAAGNVRLPLREAVGEWEIFFKIIRSSGKSHSMILEFVKDDDPGQLKRDAAALLSMGK